MNTKAMDVKSADSAFPNEKLMANLRMVVSDSEELLRITAIRPGDEAVSVRGRIQENLQAVKSSMVAAEAAMIDYTRKAEKVAEQHFHETVKYWY